ncbi:MAG TPA: type II toxin-antitoxin system VapC family toxin [Bryobacteraceae bacterium]|nr:type II toxin-antitoxin system VapC family toxin [Bryobacteraceae bacterium]
MDGTFVVDCSVAAKWLLPEPGRAAAMELYRRHARGEVSLIAPDLLLVEFASLLAKQSGRNLITEPQAREAYRLLWQHGLRLVDTRPRLFRALELALGQQLSLWDSVYVAVAVEYGCPVITADRRLFRSGKARHSSLVLLA